MTDFPPSSKTSGLRLLAVFAHPDDETFGTGGTLALYAQRGVEVHLICATRGEVGEAPPDLKGFASIGEMREDELRRAAFVLGLNAVYFLGYRDSGTPAYPITITLRRWWRLLWNKWHDRWRVTSGRFVLRLSSPSTRLAAIVTQTTLPFTGQP